MFLSSVGKEAHDRRVQFSWISRHVVSIAQVEVVEAAVAELSFLQELQFKRNYLVCGWQRTSLDEPPDRQLLAYGIKTHRTHRVLFLDQQADPEERRAQKEQYKEDDPAVWRDSLFREGQVLRSAVRTTIPHCF